MTMGDYLVTCALCGETFESENTEAESLMEYQEVFTPEMRAHGDEPPVSVCDDCYKRMMREYPPELAFKELKDRNARKQ